ncbi:ATP-dependent metallopeptidase FtsH/Yme1/Tma family protein [Brachybacterium alimentarium]|uniref:ATP-dependent zinc metalloprotease FtsH n=1 Tax=Brachybacterium alimentarium TaxID=47845 RepID=A0A2A3YJZ0_9MICO|nr:ATP-dependent zinc metalloprotease FtsH [Brachybacterium alimentarium]PCC39627.1 cell division protein FtsH [Brachybacterium alimentarium]RCS69717.1 ATP-dependent metallopeptidase FtsH/Yme1/Tma family protein [Brachybacterium alimentarium]RCS89520.1 ATP-dependent metallopeptidase FtsH/Yme1/Tma family protein [Brachybacterium alimentarium]
MADTSSKQKNSKSKKRRPLTSVAIWILVALLLGMALFSLFGRDGYQEIDTQQGLELLEGGTVEQAKIIDGNQQRVDLVLTEDFVDGDDDKGKQVRFSYVNARGADVVQAVENAAPEKGYTDEIASSSWWSTLLLSFLPLVLLIAVFWFLIMNAQGGGGKAMQFGKSKAKLFNKEAPKVTFADVAGAEEAVEELDEIKQFLVDPGRYQAVGAKIPKGVLLYGPPGTGKTLLAKAVAGEANVPFYSISGSDFVEMFVGVGASRVRDLFSTAKENAPAIIFIDEIDAVGRHRGAGMGGGHDEREQTLNQMLVEMDGFEENQNVILIAATNRVDILDPALLRPGRFDRQIGVEAPDLKGRLHILGVHAKGKPLAHDVDLEAVAKRTIGMSGADLANVLNEAALLTARSGNQIIDDRALDEAIDRVSMGPQRYSKVMSDRERQMTAYHEGGHALVAAAMNNSAPVTKVTILPRGRAGGYTMVVPTQDRNYQSRNELLDRLAYAMGGYAVEESIFHDVTTGPSSDLQNATKIARTMVMQLGMSDAVGQVALAGEQDEVFVGMQQGQAPRFSAETASVIDQEVRLLLDNALDEAWSVIVENRHVLDRLVEELLEKETLNERELSAIFSDVTKRPLREVWQSSQERPALAAPQAGAATTATGAESHDAGEPLQPNPPELPHPGGDGPEIPGAPHGDGTGEGYGYDGGPGTGR